MSTSNPIPAAPHRPAGRLRTGRAVVVIGVVAALVACVLTWTSTEGSFSDTTDNHGNAFASGSVAVGDDDANTAMFTVSGLVPGDSGSKCVTVTYSGSVAASIKLYTMASSYSGTLAPYLNLTIEQGSGGSFAGGCASFTPASQIYSGTMGTFATADTNFATGVGTFTPNGSGTTLTYRFAYSLADDNNAQNKSATIGFTWEARST